MFEIVYISGSGRSGSTLLERMFHSAPGVTALGEFHCLWRLPSAEIACSCGRTFAEDDTWGRIAAGAGLDAAILSELQDLETTVCRSGFLARHGFSIENLRANPLVARFLDLQFALFSAIAAETGARLLVDSSKAGPRAWLLACDPRVRVLHLHRDPADVLVSWRSRKFDPGLGTFMARPSIASAATDWWKSEQLAALLAARRQVLRVDYGNLCGAPRQTFEHIRTGLSLDADMIPQWTGQHRFAQGANYHSLNGNPDRFDQGPVEISHRAANWTSVPAAERPLIRLVATALRLLASALSRPFQHPRTAPE